MAIPVVCPKQALPRELDVEINISRPITEIATDMTLMCFLTPDADFLPNNNRVKYYTTMRAVEDDFAVGTSPWWAASAFFGRQTHPTSLAVGRVFDTPQPAGLLSGPLDLTALTTITDGAFSMVIHGSVHDFDNLNFSTVNTIDDVAAILTATVAANSIPASVAVYQNALKIESLMVGDDVEISYAEAPTAGTDVSEKLALTQATGAQLWAGYTPGNLADEARLVDLASRCNSRPIYGWTIDRVYRDTEVQKIFADWIEAKMPAYFSACTNSATAYNAGDETNIGFYAHNKDYKRTSVIYHHNPQVYPDVSYMALALATNYSAPDSAITMKFKQLEGIETTPMTETMLTVLNSRNINCFVAIGNTSSTTREGVQGAATWYTDTLVNLDNFREELQVEIYNVFLRTPKVPYTTAGQDKLVSAASKICRKYVRNAVFADRDIEDDTTETGYSTLPAFTIIPVNVAMATIAERAARIAPPIGIVAYEAGAFHKVTVNVDVFN